jgi:hypothetical protein
MEIAECTQDPDHSPPGPMKIRRNVMSRRRSGKAIVGLVAGLSVFTALSQAQMPTSKQPATKAPTSAQRNVPADYQSGVAQLRIAKGYLEKAGDKWGGYRIKGIASINQAFRALGVSPESTPDEMQSGNIDEPGMMNSGISSLQEARTDFANAGSDWGGRREKGVALIDQALKDLQTGIDWAKEHITY